MAAVVGLLLLCSSSAAAAVVMMGGDKDKPTPTSGPSDPSAQVLEPSEPSEPSEPVSTFVVTDESPLAEGTYIINNAKFHRKCGGWLNFCPINAGVGGKFEVKSIGDNKYSIFSKGAGKYCGADLKCNQYDDAYGADREFSFSRPEGDYHKYYNGQLLDGQFTYYHMKASTGWCEHGKGCDGDNSKEEGAYVWGFNKVSP